MEVPQVDVVDAELLQRAIESLPGPFRSSVDNASLVALPVAAQAELRREEDLAPLSGALEPADGPGSLVRSRNFHKHWDVLNDWRTTGR